MESIKIMTHKSCDLARGAKTFECGKCGRWASNYANGVNICYDCCVEDDICRICGKPLNPVLIYDNGREEADNMLGINNILKPKIKNTPLVVTTPNSVELIELPLTYEELKKKCKDQEKEIIKLKNVIKNLCE